MSSTINTISADQIVSITPAVLSGGGAALDLVGLALVTDPRVPVDSVLAFPGSQASDDFFGATSDVAGDLRVYFNGFTGSNKLPGSVLVAQYPTAAVSAYLRGADISSLTLAQLQSQGGGLTVTIDGTIVVAATIDLSAAVSFSDAAQTISTDLAVGGGTIAIATGSVGATFTATGVGTTLTTSGAVAGNITNGDTLAGVGVPVGTTVVQQIAGTPGKAGQYKTSLPTTASAAAIIDTSNVLFVTAIASGGIKSGLAVAGTAVTANTYITDGGSHVGGLGTYMLSKVQQVASETLTMTKPTVTYDSVSGAFIVTSPTKGNLSTLSFGSGTIANALGLQQSNGAVTSQGRTLATPAAFMDSIVAQTRGFATFWTLFDPDGGSGNTNKQAFAAWNQAQNNRYLYAAWDPDVSPTVSPAATTSLGFIIKQNATSGTAPISAPDEVNEHLGAFLAGYGASLDYTETNGRANAAFRSQGGLTPTGTSDLVATNLKANGYNFYGAYATRSQQFQFFYPGLVSGPFQWIDSYLNQMQLNAGLQQAILTFLTQVKSMPYNPAGYALLRAACTDPIRAAVNFGTIRPGVPLSAAQAAIVNNAAGDAIDGILSTIGYYLQILPATSQVRQARASPPATLYYMDGQSVQQVNLASILIQ